MSSNPQKHRNQSPKAVRGIRIVYLSMKTRSMLSHQMYARQVCFFICSRGSRLVKKLVQMSVTIDYTFIKSVLLKHIEATLNLQDSC